MRQAQLSTIAEQIDGSSDGDRVVARVDGYSGDNLRTVAKNLQQRGRRLVILAGVAEEKVSIVVATDGSLDAQVVVKSLASHIGGGGGGSERLAIAGGRDPSGLDRALAAANEL